MRATEDSGMDYATLTPTLPTIITGNANDAFELNRPHVLATGSGVLPERLGFHIEQSMCLSPPGIARWFTRGAIIINGTAHEIAG